MINCQIGYKGISTEIISYTKHPAKIIWDMLKQTWISCHNINYDYNNPMVRQFIKDSLEKRLNPTPQETIMIQVIFKDISRVNLAQLTRHRGWLFNSESQMPQHVSHNVMIPINIAQSEYFDRVLNLIRESQELYDEMTKGNENKETTNIPYQDARYILLNGQTTDISASFSLPQLINAVGMRFENNTHDEINYTFRALIRDLRKKIFSDPELDPLDRQIYDKLIGNCDCFGASSKKCFCTDKMFGNSFKRFEDANAYVAQTTDECLFDYKKLAWYEELKRIYHEEPELLLPGEKEMIESWSK